ncbi:MAG: phage major capsid protein [bacterium]|nr:phage major capsid protein [bacterium]
MKPQKHTRTLNLDRAAVNVEERTVEVAFSSEEPYQRYQGIEILEHGPESVVLDRLNNGGAVLVEHNTSDHVGVVESARVDGDRTARAVLRFGRGARASEIFQDVVDGIRSLVSVGYEWLDWDTEKGAKGQPDTIRVKKFLPYEISFVAIPADSTVGVGRSAEETKKVIQMTEEIKKETTTEKPAVDVKKERSAAVKSERVRSSDIMALADRHDADELARQYIDEGKSVADFQKALLEKIGENNNEVRAKQTAEVDLGLSDKEVESFSLLRVMNALADPNDRHAHKAAAYELEVCSEAANQMGSEFQARGLFIPPEILARDLSAGTATDGAELVADNLLAGSFIDVLRNSLTIRQAGAQIIPGLVGNVDIPRQTSGAGAVWISAEDGDATESDPQFDQVSLTPKDLAAYTEVTRRLRMQSSIGIEALIRNDLVVAAATAIDLAGLYGSGASGQPTGVANQTGINTFSLAAADPTYAETVRMVKEVMTDNALMGSLGYIIDPNGWEAATTTEKFSGTGKTILSENGTINGYQAAVTNQVTAEDWFFGNWADLLIGMWGGVEINVDPYTHSLKGKTRYVMFQTIDTAVRHPVSFCHCNDA